MAVHHPKMISHVNCPNEHRSKGSLLFCPAKDIILRSGCFVTCYGTIFKMSLWYLSLKDTVIVFTWFHRYELLKRFLLLETETSFRCFSFCLYLCILCRDIVGFALRIMSYRDFLVFWHNHFAILAIGAERYGKRNVSINGVVAIILTSYILLCLVFEKN